MLTNGSLFSVAALAIVLPLFLPIAVAVVAGDAIAGEAQRARCATCWSVRSAGPGCCVAKLVAVFVFVGVTVVLVAGTGFVVGRLLLGNQPLSAAVTSVSGSTLSPSQIALRTVLAIGYVAFSMLGVAAIALFLSTLTDSSLGAAWARWRC